MYAYDIKKKLMTQIFAAETHNNNNRNVLTSDCRIILQLQLSRDNLHMYELDVNTTTH